MRRWPNVSLLLAHRLRRWPNSKPTLGKRLMFAGYVHLPVSVRPLPSVYLPVSVRPPSSVYLPVSVIPPPFKSICLFACLSETNSFCLFACLSDTTSFPSFCSCIAIFSNLMCVVASLTARWCLCASSIVFISCWCSSLRLMSSDLSRSSDSLSSATQLWSLSAWCSMGRPQPLAHILVRYSQLDRCLSSSYLSSITRQPGLEHGTLTKEHVSSCRGNVSRQRTTRHPPPQLQQRIWKKNRNKPSNAPHDTHRPSYRQKIRL